MSTWRVAEVSFNGTVTIEKDGARAIDVKVPDYLPMPEKGSIVTSDGEAVIAVLYMPSLDPKSGWDKDMPYRAPGDTVIRYPNSGFLAWLRQEGKLIIGRALTSCFLKFDSAGAELKANSFRYEGNDIRVIFTGADINTPGSKPGLDVSLGNALSLAVNQDGVQLKLHNGAFIFSLTDKGLDISTVCDPASGSMVTLFHEDLTSENNSSSAGKKILDFASELTLKLAKKVALECSDVFDLSATDINLQSSGAAALGSDSGTTISGGKQVDITAPTVQITSIPSSGGGEIDIANGTVSGIKMTKAGSVGIGGSQLFLGGAGDYAVSALLLETLLTNLTTAVMTVASACSTFPPTGGAGAANAPLGAILGQLNSGFIRQNCIHYPIGVTLTTPSQFTP